MRGFLLGFLLCAALCAGVFHFVLRHSPVDPCRICSTGTRCVADLCIAQAVPAQPVSKKRHFGSRSPQNKVPSVGKIAGPNPDAADETPAPDAPPAVHLRPEDKRPKTVGDKLNATEIIHMEETTATDRVLEQQDFDAVFRPRQSDVLGCIDEARGDAQLEGQMAVAFRVRRTGQVGGVRVEAPAYLLDHGLYACVRKVVADLTFPVSGSSQVVTYPFSLR